MAAGRAWVLNLDADLELGSGSGAPRRYAPTRAVREAMAPHVAALAASLLAPGDVVVDDRTAPGTASGRPGRAFCPTARAVALLVRAGAAPEPYPSHAVLAEVNGRAFSAALGQTLPEAVFVRDLDEALALVRRAPSIAARWRAKRAFGMAGRGQRRIDPAAIDDADVAFLRSAVADGGVQLEPDLGLLRELALHGALDVAGACAIGRVVVQECDARGQWLASRTAARGEVALSTSSALEGELRRVAEALHRAGYFGPFGIDAFEYEGAQGAVRLQPRSEINARYAMGFAAGLGRPS